VNNDDDDDDTVIRANHSCSAAVYSSTRPQCAPFVLMCEKKAHPCTPYLTLMQVFVSSPCSVL